MLPETEIQQGLSFAYVRAIANVSGYGIDFPRTDYGIDACISELKNTRDGGYYSSGNILGVQIKSTKNVRDSSDHISYDLKNKYFNRLTDNSGATPIILVVFCMPLDKREWITQDIESLILKKCAYWTYLGGQPSVENPESTTAIHIPKHRIFSPEMLDKIMETIRNNGDLNGI